MMETSVIGLMTRIKVVSLKSLWKHPPSMPERPHISTRATTGKIMRLR